jgi:rod shape determining protein RodA
VTLIPSRYLRYTIWPIILAMIALMAVGIWAISASERSEAAVGGGEVTMAHTHRQIIHACAGLVVFGVATAIPYRAIGRMAYGLFGFTIVLLIAVLIVGKGRDQSRRWFDLKIFYFQPAEAAKIAYIIMLAWYLRFGDHYRRVTGLIVPFVLTFVPMALILREPDLGTCLLFLPTLYGMLFMAGARLRHLVAVVALATTLLLMPIPWRVPEGISHDDIRTRRATAYGAFEVADVEYLLMPAPLLVMKPYQAGRIEGWLRQGDEDASLTHTYQLRLSKMTLGSGGMTGYRTWLEEHGFFRRLPDDHTDFIFAIIGGLGGLGTCLGVLALYAIILLFGTEIAMVTVDPFGRMLAVGVLSLLGAQVFINIGMTMGLMPITGMTLPLISYGGSSLLINCGALGLLVNVGLRRPRSLAPRPFEHGERAEKPHALSTQ